MSTVQNSTAANSTSTLGLATAAASNSSEIQDRFLKLLVSQLKNQDPLNPMDNAQLTSQLSQISTVTGIEKLNAAMQAMSASFLSAQTLQSAALIGHTVYSDGNSLSYSGTGPARGGVDLAGAADRVNVNVLGPAGNVVRQIQLGPQNGGLIAFSWDGTNDAGSNVTPGNYTFEVKATSGQKTVPASTLVSGAVSGISLGADGAHLSVGGVGDVRMDQIKRIM